jgi:hypothetical protein
MDYSREGATASNVLAIALANKLARIAWAVLSKDCDFKCEKTDETPRCA